MKMKWSFLVAPILSATILFSHAADKLESVKKTKEEFMAAERAATKYQNVNESVQKELDRLAEQKALWERESIYYKGKLNNASSQLSTAVASGAGEQVDKWKREVALLESRVKAAEAELEKIDTQTRASIQNLQRSIKDADDNLLLPGEAIEVMVMEDDSFNGIYQVRRGGYIIMPRVGRVSLAGKD